MPLSRILAVEPAEGQIAQEAGAEWLAQRSAKLGFDVERAAVRVDGYAVHTFEKPSDPRAVRLATCDFAGVLEVRDV